MFGIYNCCRSCCSSAWGLGGGCASGGIPASARVMTAGSGRDGAFVCVCVFFVVVVRWREIGE